METEIKTTQMFYGLPNIIKLLIVLSLVLGLFFRFYALDKKVYSNDETFSTLLIFNHDLSEILKQSFDGPVIGIEDLQKYQQINTQKTLYESLKQMLSKPYVFPPAYPMLTRLWTELWTQFFNNPMAIQRSFSALISTFALFFIYWLCQELFQNNMVAWITVSLVAVSPFHIQYAQVVRPYSLLTAVTLLSSTCLLKAIRLNSKLSWMIYMLTVFLGLYSNLLFGFVIIAHSAYVLIIKNFNLKDPIIIYYLITLFGGVLSFIPWFLMFILAPSNLFAYSVEQVVHSLPLPSLIVIWIRNIVGIFFDVYDPWIEFTKAFKILGILSPLIFLIVSFSIYLIFRKTTKEVWLFIFTLVGFTGVIFIITDLMFGGSVSTRIRYLTPSVLGIEIAVAYLIYSQLIANSYLQRKLGKVLFLVLMLSGIISCGVISQAESWSAFGSPSYPIIARTINQSTRPLVIADNLGRALTLSYLLDSKVSFQLLRQPKTVKIDDNYSDVFLLETSENLNRRFEKEENYQRKVISKFSRNSPKISNVWRLEKDQKLLELKI
ncbi:hypothetical protein NIES2119_18840 [[Phormidium ambiguum] IAM M-71]|uniref:Glycosyltransferase RgtA/B/C/D-like domain-containing protein n=1 Tax=[Phormidium ambiguum] IAM M-71 TaxID=454136 RepID=A0A1U7IGD9_9CYAN|nr:glycosyltransferase family 39 protein [Phormidium ambiguum]OKH36049.1 hypothetical protein NIES2119_18840 [Phormidium ambiguum IAM M-71]